VIEAMKAEVASLVERGEIDGDPGGGMTASDWAARLDELKGMAGDSAARIDCSGGDTGGIAACKADARPGPSARRKAPRGHSGDWRERLNRARQSAARRAEGPRRVDEDGPT